MKNLILIFGIIISIYSFGCNKNYWEEDNEPPKPPTGLYSINGDNKVELHWTNNNERNIFEYNIYVSDSYDGKYDIIGTTSNNFYVDLGAKNGVTWYYAVTAVNQNGYESDLSYEEVKNTPRPQGYNKAIYDFRKFPSTAGYSFAKQQVLPYDDKYTDMFFDNDSGYYYMVVWDDTDIQDMGKTTDIYDIPYAPTTGWSSTKDVVLIPGHTYVVWTLDNNFAKFRINAITTERVSFDWAYQTKSGERQLKASKTGVRSFRNLDSIKIYNPRFK